MEKYKSILVIVTVLFLLILANTGYYLFSSWQNNILNKKAISQSKVAAVTFKIYENSKLGFQFKYPPTWILKEKDNTVDINSPAEGNTLYFSAGLRNDFKSLDEIKGKLAPSVPILPAQVDTALGFKYADDDGHDNIWLMHSDKIYFIRTYFSMSKADTTASQILETFKFTN